MTDGSSDEEIRRLSRLAGDCDIDAAERLLAAIRRRGALANPPVPPEFLRPKDPKAHARMLRQEARVDGVSYGIEQDHGILTFNIHFSARGFSQGFGGYVLGGSDGMLDAQGADLVDRACGVLGVARLEDAAGATATLLYEKQNDYIRGIEKDGRTLIVEDWLSDWGARSTGARQRKVRHYQTGAGQ